VDGYCVPCPDYECDPECESGDCCVDGECEPCTACDPGDCPSGQCCVDGFCTDCPDPCSPGDCGDGYCCVDGFCLPCPPRECPDTPCPSGECCIDGYCINPCPEGEYCCNGVCQEEPCDAECAEDADCPVGQCCVDSVCENGFCHYTLSIGWTGAGNGTCPGGFTQSGVNEFGQVICLLCETVQEAECDDQGWATGKVPEGDWVSQVGVTGDCNAVFCGGACSEAYPGACCPGCSCEEVEPDVYECVAEEPPP